jgi:hypothetical protein
MLCFEQDLGNIFSVLSIEIRECTHGMLKKEEKRTRKRKQGRTFMRIPISIKQDTY